MEVEMDVSGLHHHNHQQEICSQTLESMLQVCTKAQDDKKPRPPEEALKCPRCDSSNTKFCYYNNYSLTQPRYFCKSCRRYWTKGGTLRNVPVGGGCRKNKRISTSSSATSSNSSSACSKRPPQDPHHLHLINHHHHHHHHPLSSSSSSTSGANNHLLAGLPHLPYDSSSTCCTTDLSLAFARLHQSQPMAGGFDHFDHGGDHQLGLLGFLENTNNVLYNGGNIGNVEMGGLMGLNNNNNNNNLDEEQQKQVMNTMFVHDDQDQLGMMTCGAATTAVTMTTVKQEACNMMRSSSSEQQQGVLWGFPWQNVGGGGGEQGNMIGGWNNGIGSTNWHGLINSPLM